MKFIIVLVSIFLVFSSCQRKDISADETKITLERTYNQNFILDSVFYDMGQMAEGIWLNCSMYGDKGFDNLYVDSKNKELVLRKGGVKNIEIGVSESYEIINSLGYPEEMESSSKYIYKKNIGKNECIISFFFSPNGVLENIVYNVFKISY